MRTNRETTPGPALTRRCPELALVGKRDFVAHLAESWANVRDSFWRGRRFASLTDMQTRAISWCRELAGVRAHRSLDGASPLGAHHVAQRRSRSVTRQPWKPKSRPTAKSPLSTCQSSRCEKGSSWRPCCPPRTSRRCSPVSARQRLLRSSGYTGTRRPSSTQTCER
jgi:hypothetical protein